MQGQYNSVAAIKRKNKREGYHFFSIKTMRFWGSKVYGELYGGCVFVTSERTYDDTTRYNIRVGMSNGSIHSYSYGTDFGTLEDAKAIAKRLGDSIATGSTAWNADRGEFVTQFLFGESDLFGSP